MSTNTDFKVKTSLDLTHPDGAARGTWACDCGATGSLYNAGPIKDWVMRQIVLGQLSHAAQQHSDQHKDTNQ